MKIPATDNTRARANSAPLGDEVTDHREAAVVRRCGAAGEEFGGLPETAQLLPSPANAERLLAAPARAQRRALPTQSLDE